MFLKASKKLAYCLAVCILLFPHLLYGGSQKNVYRASLRAIPQSLNIRQATSNTEFYVAHQIYHPLYSLNSTSKELESYFLDMKKSKAMDSTFSRFVHCLKNGVLFSDATPITVDDLRLSLEQTHLMQNFPRAKTVEIVEGCVRVQLENPVIDYFHFLSRVGSTVLKGSTLKNPFPTGMGYYVPRQMAEI